MPDFSPLVADLSPSLMDDLQLTTDDEVQVIFPYKENKKCQPGS